MVAMAILGGFTFERRDIGMLIGFLGFEGLLLAGAWHLNRFLRDGAPLEKAARWEALSRQVEQYMDGRHPRIARGRAVSGTMAMGDQLLLRGPDYWIQRPAQFNARLGVVRDELLQLEFAGDGHAHLRLWAGTAGLVGRGPQSWILEFEPGQWAKLAPHFPKEQP
jgi:hypothetical protein